MWTLLANALANPSFNGVWKLDRDASDGVSHILEAQGLSWVERTLAERGTPTHAITWSPDHAQVQIVSGWYRRTDELPLDGAPRTVELSGVGPATLTSWMRDGAWITRAEITTRDGQPAVIDSLRRLSADDTLRLTMSITVAKGPPLTAERVFRRQ